MLFQNKNRALVLVAFCLICSIVKIQGWPSAPSVDWDAINREKDRIARETTERLEREAREAADRLTAGNLAKSLFAEAKSRLSSISVPSLDSYVQKFNAVPNLEKLAKRQEKFTSKNQLKSLLDLKKNKQALKGVLSTVNTKLAELRSKRDEYTKKLGDVPFGLGNDFKNQIQVSSDNVINSVSQQVSNLNQALVFLDMVINYVSSSTKQAQGFAAGAKKAAQNAVDKAKAAVAGPAAGVVDFAKGFPGNLSNLVTPPSKVWILELSADKTGKPMDFVNITKATEEAFIPGTGDVASALVAMGTKRKLPWPDSKDKLTTTLESLRTAAKAAKSVVEGKSQLQGVLDVDAVKFVTVDIKDLVDMLDAANADKLKKLGTRVGDKFVDLTDVDTKAVNTDMSSVVDLLQAFDESGEFTVAKAAEMKTSLGVAVTAFDGAAESYNNYDATTADAKKSLKEVFGKDLTVAEAQEVSNKFKNVLKTVFGQSFAAEEAKEAKDAAGAKAAADAKAADAKYRDECVVLAIPGLFDLRDKTFAQSLTQMSGVPGGARCVSVGKKDGFSEIWAIGNDSLPYRWNGTDWTQLSGVAHASGNISVGSDGAVFIIGTDNRFYRWNFAANVWNNTTGGAGKKIACADQSFVTVVGMGDNIHLSRDGGNNWPINFGGSMIWTAACKDGDKEVVWGVGSDKIPCRWNSVSNSWEKLSGFSGCVEIHLPNASTILVLGSDGKAYINEAINNFGMPSGSNLFPFFKDEKFQSVDANGYGVLVVVKQDGTIWTNTPSIIQKK